MVRRLLPRLLLCLAVLAGARGAAAVTPADLRRHIDILAGDAFEGRAPGTPGEEKAVGYIADQFRAAGLEPVRGDGGWLQPVELAVRTPAGNRALWNGRPDAGPEELLLIGREAREEVRGAPVVFAGHGAVMADRGIDQLGGADLKGAVVLILYEGPGVPGFPGLAERVKAVAARGAAAVIAVVAGDIPWVAVEAAYEAGQKRLADEPAPPVQGAMSQATAERLVQAAGADLGRLLDAAPGTSFTPVRLALTASLEVDTQIRTFTSYNVAGRLRGSGRTGESLLYLAHWDHLGVCSSEADEDRICNGAVDNASGVASLIEIARGLAAGPRPVRDILFLATTAEEMGLLGAAEFAARPPVPLASIVAALNLDTVAIAPRGEKVAVIGRGVAEIDALVAGTARDLGRVLDEDDEADEFVERQDGWALQRAGVPALMVGGAFSDLRRLGAFLGGAYHQPEDNPGPGLVLDGAAEDADLLIALGRRLADPAQYRRPRPLAPPAKPSYRP